MAVIYTASGVRTVSDELVRHVIDGGRLGRYQQVTLVLADKEISGLMLGEAFATLRDKLEVADG